MRYAIYQYDNDNKSRCLVRIAKILPDERGVVEIRIIKVYVDDSGNGLFTYLQKTGKPMNASLKYLHPIQEVLISIRPEWCAKIASGQKTVEVRKTAPKCGTPFLCRIYCTEPNTTDPKRLLETHNYEDGHIYRANGKVCAEFICDEIIDIWPGYAKGDDCLTYEQQESYLGPNGHGYGWRISNLEIYPIPKELSVYGIKKAPQSWIYLQPVIIPARNLTKNQF